MARAEVPDRPPGEVLVMGAGTIGCFVGGRLAAAGVPVTFVGRPRVLQGLAEHGLALTDLEGGTHRLPAASLRLSEQVPVGAMPALVLLCVKSGATAEAAAELAFALPAGTLVVSLQNGISNCAAASRVGPTLQVLPGMVPYNVAEIGPGAFHRGTAGRLAAQDDAALRRCGPGCRSSRGPACRSTFTLTCCPCNGASCCSTSTIRSMRSRACR